MEKFINENPKKKDGDRVETRMYDDIPNAPIFDNLKKQVDSVLNRSAYNKVDLDDLFSFMNVN